MFPAIAHLGRCSLILGLLAALVAPASVSASEIHPFSQVTGTFFVTGNRVSARLTIFVEDLYLFHEMEPDEQDRLYAEDMEPAREAHRQFLLDRVRILDASGKPLESRIVDVSPLEIPETGWSVDELMDHTLDYDLEYELPERPEFLTFVQDIVDPNFVFRSELRLVVRQEGNAELAKSIIRPGDPFTVRFDWDRENLGAEASEAEIEEWLSKDREATLGITSYDSVYSFLYITRREVRHEILIPLGTLARIFEIPRADPDFLTVAEQDTARELIEQYYAEGNPVKIDGIEVPPIADRIDFYGLNLKDFAQQAEPRDVSMASGRVGVILAYPCKGVPSEVELTWTKFTSDVRKVETVVFCLDKTDKFEFSRFKEDNTFQWTNPDPSLDVAVRPIAAVLAPPQRWPWISLVLVGGWIAVCAVVPLVRKHKLAMVASGTLVLGLACLISLTRATWTPLPWDGAPRVAEEEQSAIIRSLLSNVYRAFDYRDQEEIYDSLEQSVTGEMLSDLYLEIRRELEIKQQGGAVALVDQVEFVDLAPQESMDGKSVSPPGFVVRCRWNVEGTVEHWGHIHRRKNQYAADFEVQPHDGDWRLVGIDLTHEERLNDQRELRKF